MTTTKRSMIRRLFGGVKFTRDDYEDWRAQVGAHEIVIRKCQNGGGAGFVWAVILDPAKGPDGKLLGAWPQLRKAAKYGIKHAQEQVSQVSGEAVKVALMAGKILSNGVVTYQLVNEVLITRGHLSGESWPAPWTIEELVRAGRFFDVLKKEPEGSFSGFAKARW